VLDQKLGMHGKYEQNSAGGFLITDPALKL
jgi:hypothetical protein